MLLLTIKIFSTVIIVYAIQRSLITGAAFFPRPVSELLGLKPNNSKKVI